jgi:hypothetical protein
VLTHEFFMLRRAGATTALQLRAEGGEIETARVPTRAVCQRQAPLQSVSAGAGFVARNCTAQSFSVNVACG